jgi:hypothetical protein
MHNHNRSKHQLSGQSHGALVPQCWQLRSCASVAHCDVDVVTPWTLCCRSDSKAIKGDATVLQVAYLMLLLHNKIVTLCCVCCAAGLMARR